jgi:predicted acetyltransferase
MTVVNLVLAERSQLPVLENLWQLYMHDFSEFMDASDEGAEVDDRGLYAFEFDLRRYWERPGFWPYLAHVRERIAGFVLVSDRVRFHRGGRYIDEFFVLRRYRRRGIGRTLAFQTFETQRGYWEIAEIPGNRPAQAFWRRVIADYTDSRFDEIITPDGEVWQHFNSSLW